MTEYKPGSRWQSQTGRGSFVVVKGPAGDGELTCGGQAVQPQVSVGPAEKSEGADDGSIAGKRYTEDESGLEVLCVQSSDGTLAFDGRALSRKNAKPLPSSD